MIDLLPRSLPRLAFGLGLVLVVGCGKAPRESSSAEAKTEGQAQAPAQARTAVPGAPAHASADPPRPGAPVKPPVKAASRGPEHAVYSMIDNRLSAHLTRGGGLVVPAGSAGMAKYVRFGNVMHSGKKTWDLRQAQDDTKVARMTGSSGTVFVPLTAAQAARNTLRFRVFAAKDGAVSVRVNDNKDINGQATQGWSTVELAVPAGQLHEGENSLNIFMKGS